MRNLLEHIKYGIKSTIGKNIISLYLLSSSYHLLPLITIPYLVRILGPEKFGLVAFGQSLMMFFAWFVNYGFELTATRTISIKRKNNEEVSRIACSVWTSKALLCVIGLIVLLLLIQFVPKMNQNSLLLIILFGIPVGNMLLPNWLFFGLERMKAMSAINIMMRVFTTVFVFVLIHNPDDYLIYAGLLSFQWIIAGIGGIWFSITKLKIRINIPKFDDIAEVISDGWRLFVSNIGSSIYISLNSFILGVLTNYTVVGYYSAAEKITLSLVSLFRPIAQAVYPRFSQMASSSMNLVLLWGRRMVYVMGGLGLMATLFVFFGAPIIVRIILGPEYGPSVSVLQILSILLLLMALSDVFSNQIMLPFKKDSYYSLIRVIAAISHVLLALLIVPRFDENGMAFVFVITQIFILFSTIIALWYWGLTPFHYKKDEDIQDGALNLKPDLGFKSKT